MRTGKATLRTSLGPLSILVATMLAGWPAHPARAQAAPAAAVTAAASTAKPTASRVSSGPRWSDLNATQRQALEPLAAQWDTISEGQKRKWIALAGNFNRLPPAEQAKLHSRMIEWLALSPRQRADARLNFGETQQLSADEKKAKWEAYQALPDEEKRRLAASGAKRLPTTAAAIRPVPADKLASVPRNASSDTRPARIVTTPPAAATDPRAGASSPSR